MGQPLTAAVNRRAYSRMETDAELIARVRAPGRTGETVDDTAARYGFARRIVWEDK